MAVALDTLLVEDIDLFARLGVPEELLERARIQRVSDREAEDVFGIQYAGDKSGIVFPYYIADRRVTARLRRDNPDVDLDGKALNKYICAWGDRRHLYFGPGFLDTVKADSGVALVAVEAEKSALAGTAWAERTGARLVFFALGGCWGWRGRIGKAESANGTRVDVKGALPDLAVCDGRKVYILLDSNIGAQPKVQDAERAFVAELRKRKCDVFTCRIPAGDGVNGPDDLIAAAGDDALADVIAKAKDPKELDCIPAYSEGNLALKFAQLHGADMRFTKQWDQWNIFNGHAWAADQTDAVGARAFHLCHEAAAVAGSPVVARSVDSAKTKNAVERLARVVQPFPVVSSQWDSDPWLLNTPGGRVNLMLKTEHAFELMPNRAQDYCTKLTGATPGGDCPIFLSFLEQTTGGDKELEAYLQMVCGYFLTGVTTEQLLFDIYGQPGTGKTTLVETISKVMGTYAIHSAIETFTESAFERHTTELARLEGARLVKTTETADGHFLHESKVNSVTGGEPITAHLMFHDDTTFYPVFKLLIAGNFRPRLKNPNGGIRRRVRLIPLDNPVPNRDGDLPEKLKAEYGGILRWMITGCRKWQEAGKLKSPKAVEQATDEYLTSEDGIGRWLDERTAKNLLPVMEPSAGLYSDYKQWSEAGKEFYYSAKRFAMELESRGYKPDRTMKGRGFLGIKLLNRVTP